ncbi:MAG: nucleoid occlusion protein [Dethiobacter sp.]|jgi:ParB family chromosome partitioning protein|nr:nucleoid occlusion protein [Dethiobacter sp.]
MAEAWSNLIKIDPNDFKKDDIRSVELEKIRPNPFQPRKVFDEEKINELSQSIKTYGLLQPVILRKKDNNYQLVAGERRCLACKAAGWTSIPAIIRELSDNAMATIALIENLQREDLHFLEEAAGYQKLLDEFGLTQEVLAQRMGKSQSTIANKIRLLKLPGQIRDKIMSGDITERHARALLRLPDEESQMRVFNDVANLGLTVKQAEDRIEEFLKSKSSRGTPERKKVIVRDLRIFINTLRQAVKILEKAGLQPDVKEIDKDDFFEIRISLPKAKAKT